MSTMYSYGLCIYVGLLGVVAALLYTFLPRPQFPNLVPGANITDLAYLAFNATLQEGTTRSQALFAAHKKLGPTVTLGPKRTSFASPEAIKDIYGTGTKCIKGDQYTTAGGVPNIFTEVNKERHAVKRKRLSAAFANKHLLAWEEKVVKNIFALVQQLDSRERQILDWRYWSNLFTLDAILAISLSHESRFLQNASDTVHVQNGDGGKTISMLSSVRANNRALGPIIWSPTCFSALKWLTQLLPSYRRQWKLAEEWQELVCYFVSLRLKADSEGQILDDLFSSLLRGSKSNDLNLSEEELRSEVSILLEAGSDTTSIALTHVLYYLAKHPRELNKLRSELQIVCEPGRIIPSYAQVASVPYLKACLDESLRLQPPLSSGQQRRTPPEGLSIAGTWIEGNINVSVASHVAHRDVSIFGECADQFLPERWLNYDDEARSRMQRHVLTFSAGARVCIGKNISYIEQMLLVATIVLRYDFELPSTSWELEWEEYFNLWPKGLPLTFRLRQGVASMDDSR